ncbi:ankyrin repeat domain-containing protein [Armatimonas sp.]|uniref:ankyrin repeat domain-containing protein n=1 Tax=Armatimonas sp. TaxID=1872638 RepID=UPI00286C4B07|nr:ankyrin repeat domain-containing protein [Armatimonas sp.]
MSSHFKKTSLLRLSTGVGVLLACFLAVGIWKATSSSLHKNTAPPSAPTVDTEPLATPSAKPPAPAPPKDKNTLLADAVKAEALVTVKALLEKGANPNGAILEKTTDWSGQILIDFTPMLSWAASKGSLEIVKLLLRHGADVDPKGYRSPLSEAAFSGEIDTAKLLLRHGAEVNPKGQQSPLAWATYFDSDALPMMKLLIRHGADVNARFDKKGTTVMTIAQFHSGDGAVALLKRYGARR